jgi:hypothetical protein
MAVKPSKPAAEMALIAARLSKLAKLTSFFTL